MAHQHSAVMTGTHKYPGISILCLTAQCPYHFYHILPFRQTHTHLYFCHTVNVLQCAVTAVWPWLLIKFLSELCFCASTGLLGRPQIHSSRPLKYIFQFYISISLPVFLCFTWLSTILDFDWSTGMILYCGMIFPNIYCC